MRARLLALLAAPLALAAAAPPPDPEDARAPVPAGFYRLAAATRLPGANPDWDYLAWDGAHGHLLIGRRGAGLWVFDPRRQRLVARIARSEGAGAALVVPALRRGFTTNGDGSTTVFDLATLKTVARVKFAEDADSASYDPATGRIAFVSGDSHQLSFLDARRLVVTGHLELAARKPDASAADGHGQIFLNQRDKGTVARIAMASGTISAEWPVTGCSQPTGMAIDPDHGRLFVGCRGAQPVLAVLDTASGAVVQTLPIGRGNDGVAWDAWRRRIITTNGVDANVVIMHQDDPDHYRFEQAFTTRPNARTLAYDPAMARIFTVTAEGVVNPAAARNTGPAAFYPNAYHDNSFVVLTYAVAPGGGRRPAR